MCVPDVSEMYRVNVDGTRNVVRAAGPPGSDASSNLVGGDYR